MPVYRRPTELYPLEGDQPQEWRESASRHVEGIDPDAQGFAPRTTDRSGCDRNRGSTLGLSQRSGGPAPSPQHSRSRVLWSADESQATEGPVPRSPAHLRFAPPPERRESGLRQRADGPFLDSGDGRSLWPSYPWRE